MKFSNYSVPVNEKNKPVIILEEGYGKTSEKLFCRDPFILPFDGKYYLYRTKGEAGIECLVSPDLENWSKPVQVYFTTEEFHGVDCFFWAPECHYYNGYFYIFTSVMSNICGHRTISAYRSDNPLGPFKDISHGRLSPKGWDCIDGTLYVDTDGAPWLVFVHEWSTMPDKVGTIAIARLNEDFTKLVSEPIEVVRADTPDWAVLGVTDAPFMYTCEDGGLLMLWSNFSEKGYVSAQIRSDSGKIEGPWRHLDEKLYEKGLKDEFMTDGGHGMLFRGFDGDVYFCMHGPNAPSETDYEHLCLYKVRETDGRLEIC